MYREKGKKPKSLFCPYYACDCTLQSLLHIYPLLVLFWWWCQPVNALFGRGDRHNRRGHKWCCPHSLFSPYYACECTLQPLLHIYPLSLLFCWWWLYFKNPGLKFVFARPLACDVVATSTRGPDSPPPAAHSNLQLFRPPPPERRNPEESRVLQNVFFQDDKTETKHNISKHS